MYNNLYIIVGAEFSGRNYVAREIFDPQFDITVNASKLKCYHGINAIAGGKEDYELGLNAHYQFWLSKHEKINIPPFVEYVKGVCEYRNRKVIINGSSVSLLKPLLPLADPKNVIGISLPPSHVLDARIRFRIKNNLPAMLTEYEKTIGTDLSDSRICRVIREYNDKLYGDGVVPTALENDLLLEYKSIALLQNCKLECLNIQWMPAICLPQDKEAVINRGPQLSCNNFDVWRDARDNLSPLLQERIDAQLVMQDEEDEEHEVQRSWESVRIPPLDFHEINERGERVPPMSYLDSCNPTSMLEALGLTELIYNDHVMAQARRHLVSIDSNDDIPF